jgi:DNA relaxase NicK
MLHRKTLVVFLLALVFGCTEYKEWKKARRAELEKIYQQQLISYNDQINEEVKKWYSSGSLMAKADDKYLNVFWAAQQRYALDQAERNINELMKKRSELKERIIEHLGYLPEWWTKTKLPYD